ncbi:hypothetical protein AVEN_180434-1 [Araneus ventricosus]|uniref:Uncharacterized protein n=1 Tax=Araneus ventricosus TaxID=182803 RepID=A0A4Y2MMV4_ARAVE|nr:hypothetical protein AVEN_180434-1 [Araneus ventricosus]
MDEPPLSRSYNVTRRPALAVPVERNRQSTAADHLKQTVGSSIVYMSTGLSGVFHFIIRRLENMLTIHLDSGVSVFFPDESRYTRNLSRVIYSFGQHHQGKVATKKMSPMALECWFGVASYRVLEQFSVSRAEP